MIGYKTSTDYKRLRDLLDAGHHVVVWSNIVYDVGMAMRLSNFGMFCYLIGHLSYVCPTEGEKDGDFERFLKDERIEFIEPNNI